MKRYSIMVRMAGAETTVELCQCNSNPEELVKAAQAKKRTVKGMIRDYKTPIYEHVAIVENANSE